MTSFSGSATRASPYVKQHRAEVNRGSDSRGNRFDFLRLCHADRASAEQTAKGTDWRCYKRSFEAAALGLRTLMKDAHGGTHSIVELVALGFDGSRDSNRTTVTPPCRSNLCTSTLSNHTVAETARHSVRRTGRARDRCGQEVTCTRPHGCRWGPLPAGGKGGGMGGATH